MNIYLITGSSKGLGEAFVKTVLKEGNIVYAIARSKSEKLATIHTQGNGILEQLSYDLSDISGLSAFMNSLFGRIPLEKADTITLINNAGIVEPMKPIERCNSAEIERSFQVNTVAPMALTSEFLQHTEEFKGKKYILNISSGAANRSVYGWSVYSATKAALDRFTESAALEEREKENPTKIIAIAPGVVDTNMQSQIRATNKDDFKDVENFRSLKENDQLLKPEAVAEKSLKWLMSNASDNGVVYHIRDL
ncbi:(S)-benzoin forming benzil reductase [Bacillus tianshenii]|nr:(S)-benzoin forming benzil reductase [Bacillus tianshenii]